MKKIITYTCTLVFFLIQQNLYGQPQIVTVTCGKQIKQEFGTASKEHQEIKITLKAGEKLTFKAIPTGDYLNLRAEIKDPGNNLIFPADRYRNKYVEPMFDKGLRSLEITTGTLSASGTYTIIIFNNYKGYKKDARAGEYTFVTTCE
jgi:hypothetical protein